MAWIPTGDPGPGGRIRGGLPARGLHQQYNPPDAVTAPGASAGTFRGRLVVIFGGGANTGIFVYTTAPGPGNLLATIAASGGTDPYGNNYVSGITSYSPEISGADAINIFGNTIAFLFSGQLTSGGMGISSSGLFEINSGTVPGATGPGVINLVPDSVRPSVQIPNPVLLAAFGGLTVTGGLTADSETVNGTLSAQALSAAAETLAGATPNLLQVTNTDAAQHATPTLRLIEQLAGSAVIGLEVAGDTTRRLRVNGDGSMSWGPGNANQDATLYRAAAGKLAASTLAADVGGTPETWHAIAGAGFFNGWTATAGRMAPSYQLCNDGWLGLAGSVTVPAGFAAGQNVLQTGTKTAYFSPTNKPVFGRDTTNDNLIVFNLTTGGFLRYQSGTTVAGHNIDFTARLPLDI